MDADQYAKHAARTDSPEFNTDLPAELVHGAMGLATESAELLDQIKRAMFYGTPLDLVNILEELGDQCWYIAQIMRGVSKMTGTDVRFEDIMVANVRKLQQRYPEQFSQDKANERDLRFERDVLEEAFHHIFNPK